jgi:hypothetical protein
LFALDFLEDIQKELDAISKLGLFDYVKVPANNQKEVISSESFSTLNGMLQNKKLIMLKHD